MNALLALDQHFFFLINHLPHTTFTDWLGLFLSGIGKAGFIWFVLGGILFLREEKKHHQFFIPIIGAGVISWIIIERLLKPYVARPRPTPILNDFSFPSGHATIAFALAYVLSRYEPRWKVWFYTLAVLISFSRIYLGVHYPIDVIGGGILGILIGWLSLMRGNFGQRK